MFFTKEDKNKLNFVYEALTTIIRDTSLLDNIALKPEILEAKNKKKKEDKISVGGGLDFSHVAEEEQEETREQIGARFSNIRGGMPFYEEELLSERELEAIE